MLVLALATNLLCGQDQVFQEKAGFELESQNYFEQAEELYHSGEKEMAAESYSLAYAADPSDPKPLYNLALTHFELEDYGKAAVALEKLFLLNPTDTAAMGLYGHTLLQCGKAAEAVACFDVVLYTEATDALFVDRALANISLNRTNDAMRDFDEALRLNPHNFEACLGKGTVYRDLNQPKLAIAWLEKALTARPGDASALSNLAIVKYQVGEKEEAMDCFRRALQSAKISEIYLKRAQCYLLERNFSDAIADAREAMLLDGENPAVYAFIGDVEIEKSDYEAAIESFGVAIDLKPDQADYYMGRASASIKHELYYEAVNDLYRALDLKPFSTDARKMLQDVYSRIDAEMLGQSGR